MIKLIAAITRYPEIGECVVGIDGQLPHTSPEDMSRFNKLTTGGIVIMGRKTFESIGKPLPGRYNGVLTRHEDGRYAHPGIVIYYDLVEAITDYQAAYGDHKDIWIIGGGEVYRQALEMDLPDRLYISEMKKEGVEDIIAAKDVVLFPHLDFEMLPNDKALYIEDFEDHTFKILSKTSLDVL